MATNNSNNPNRSSSSLQDATNRSKKESYERVAQQEDPLRHEVLSGAPSRTHNNNTMLWDEEALLLHPPPSDSIKRTNATDHFIQEEEEEIMIPPQLSWSSSNLENNSSQAPVKYHHGTTTSSVSPPNNNNTTTTSPHNRRHSSGRLLTRQHSRNNNNNETTSFLHTVRQWATSSSPSTPARQRTQSEPDASRLFWEEFREVQASNNNTSTPKSQRSSSNNNNSSIPVRRRQRGRANTEDVVATPSPWRSKPPRRDEDHNNDLVNSNSNTASVSTSSSNNNNHSTPAEANTVETTAPPDQQQHQDSERRARTRWVRINRRFQVVITLVAILFSLLLFCILICWVALTSSYIVSFEKDCAVPLKTYFWLVTLQLVLDVFRSDIMRTVFQYDAWNHHHQTAPCRVVMYNVAYLIYAMLVLRLGIVSIFVNPDAALCERTAPELYKSSLVFCSLSIAAWMTIVCGYVLPFGVVAIMLTCNGYNPSSPAPQPVFPAAYSRTGAPPGCIDFIPVVDTATVVSRECCICMEDFRPTDVVVKTVCKHVFHKACCREWLLQARTCPVCRLDIPTSHLEQDQLHQEQPRVIPMGPTGRPVAGLLRMWRAEERGGRYNTTSAGRAT